ncbi:MAG: flagellar motor switch protein FliN [Pseudomonadota bacterium]
MADTDNPNQDPNAPEEEAAEEITAAEADDHDAAEAEGGVDDEALADEWAAALAEQKESGGEEPADPDALLNEAQGGDDSAAGASATEAGVTSEEAEPRERRHKPDPAAEPMQPQELDPASAQAGRGPADGDDLNLQMVLDVPVTMAMEIGRTRIPIRNLLQLNQGSVVELDRLAGEPLDVLVNGTLIAHGEVVVVNDKFGIRLTDVISPSERIRKLK